MHQWYVKDLSKMTGVSIQTLHHYDRIQLLCPSVREANGYRLYSEKDLVRLQQIIALKFFGFALAEIKTLLSGPVDLAQHLADQAACLEAQSQSLLVASQTLKTIIAAYAQEHTIAWEQVIQLIEVYKMQEKPENAWTTEVFNKEQLQQYAKFEAGLKDRFDEKAKTAFEKKWATLLSKLQAKVKDDPTTSDSIALANEVITLIRGIYGTEHQNLMQPIWEEGYKKGKIDRGDGLSPEIVAWIDKAMRASRSNNA